jgi:serine/threonine protein kinase
MVSFYAPEMFADVYDVKCDIWSLGVLMHVLLTGNVPFFGITLKQTRDKIMNEQVSFDADENPTWDRITSAGKAFM